MQRYSKQSDGKRSSWMATDDDGEYVKYSDHITQLEAALAAATVVPAEVVRSAEVLRDWLLPYGHPEKGMAGINPIALSAEELSYKSRDEFAMQLCNFILSLAVKGKGGA